MNKDDKKKLGKVGQIIQREIILEQNKHLIKKEIHY
jgi:hypothetical protein